MSEVQGISGSVGEVLGEATVTATARVKPNFSWGHWNGARHLAALARRIEASAVKTEQATGELRAYVSGTVLLAAAFLEASINELFLEANDPGSNTLEGLAKEQIAVLAELWETVEPSSPLSKYQIALAACGKERFDKGAEPWQGADALVKTRDALMHSKPEWSDELDVHKKLEARLKDRFAPNSLVPGGLMWFPHLCLGAGCAEWAVDQAKEFSEQFCERMGIRSRLPPVPL